MKLAVLQYQNLGSLYEDDFSLSVEKFADQMSLLSKHGYTSISCEQLYKYLMHVDVLPPRPILLTFDGGYSSQYEHAQSILKENGFHAVFFVAVEFVLRSCLSDRKGFEHHMDIRQLWSLQEAGHEIGLHGYANLNFIHSNVEDIRNDIAIADQLFKKLKIPKANILAYPHGAKPSWFWNTLRVYNMLSQQKVMLAFGLGNRINDLEKVHRFNIHRISLNERKTTVNFEKHILQQWNY